MKLTSLHHVLVVGHVDCVHTADNCAADSAHAVQQKSQVDNMTLEFGTDPSCNFADGIALGCDTTFGKM